jgi:hypothetical protein
MRYQYSLAALSMTLWFAATPAFAESNADETSLFQARIKDAARNLPTGRRSRTCLRLIVKS